MILSLDISSSCIGYSVFYEDGKLAEANFVKFNSKHSKFEKLNFFKDSTKHIILLPIKNIVIEEPLKRFAGKFSSADTLAVLNFFNGLISSYLYGIFNIEPIYYNVRSIRATVFPNLKIEEKGGNSKKHAVWESVMNMYPNIEWRYGLKSRKLLEENYDIADSIAVGLYFQIITKKQIETNLNKTNKP